MDYPKSVPGVGLVDGKFVDEDQVSGTPGSLIPAAWGNAVTDELLGVLAEAAIAPAEGNNGQLRLSIKAIALNVIRLATSKATELLWGVLRVGTQAEVNAGALDDVAVTPKKLRWGFAISLGGNGYVVFPSWLGGLIFQWGLTAGSPANTVLTVSFPIAYPVWPLAVFMNYVDGSTQLGAGRGSPWQVGSSNKNGFNYSHNGSSNSAQFFWFSIGQ